MLKYVDEWKLSKKAKAVVKAELGEWIKVFVERSNGAREEVHRLNFKENDIFYFTNCNDILSKDPESRTKETNKKIVVRKDNIFIRLFLKQLIGEKIEFAKSKCSHCGYEYMEIYSCYDGFSYYHFCPKCKMIILVTFPNGVISGCEYIRGKLIKKSEEDKWA